MHGEINSQKDELPKADAELDTKYLIFFSVIELLHLSLSKGREMRALTPLSHVRNDLHFCNEKIRFV